MHWNEGYVSDLSYPGAVYRQQMPSHLDAACLIAGVAPAVEPGEPFTYCELGCGIGDTAMAVAAANPKASVWGFDFNPAHVAEGRTCARDIGLDNLVIEERSFRDLAEVPPADMPMFDYVTAHGVWSWISPANRDHIVTFLSKSLRAGGVFSVSYNALPGWTGTVALQRLLLEARRRTSEGSEAGLRQALALARRVVDTGRSVLDDIQVSKLEDLVRKGEIGYLTHEYLNEYWSPVFHADVVAALAPAKLGYVAAAELVENFPELCFRPEQKALIEELPSSLRQHVGDYFSPRTFRKDVFVRGARHLPARRLEACLRAQSLALTVPLKAATREIGVPVGKATLQEGFYAPALAMLDGGNATVGALVDAAPPGTAPATTEIAAMLIGTAQVLPVRAEGTTDAMAGGRASNLARVARAFALQRTETWLVSPGSGATIRAGLLEMLLFQYVASRAPATLQVPDIRAGVVALTAQHGMSINRDADRATGASHEVDIETFVAETLPIWRRLGLV